MTREAVFTNALNQYGTVPDYPWQDENAVLRHKDNNKWYGLVMQITRNKLGFEDDVPVDVLNVKCDPDLIHALQMKEGYHPAFHMNKSKWISIRLDGSVPEDEVLNLLALSHKMTAVIN